MLNLAPSSTDRERIAPKVERLLPTFVVPLVVLSHALLFARLRRG